MANTTKLVLVQWYLKSNDHFKKLMVRVFKLSIQKHCLNYVCPWVSKNLCQNISLVQPLVFSNKYSIFQFLKGNLCLVELFEINSTLFCNNRDIVCVQSLPRLVIEWILVGHGMICVHLNI
jgi:hypothetical protein